MSRAAFDFDLFVIGAGSGGVRAARVAAEHGARVGIAEEFRWGGTCVIRGCVPKKLMAYARDFRDAFEDAPGFGWRLGEASFDWPAFMAAKEAELDRLEGAYRDRLDRAGVRLFATRATLADAHRVHLASGESFSASHILIATGGAPYVPDLPGGELAITSNELLSLPAQPRRLVVVGGGYIACEFASILNGLGSEVRLLYRGKQILRGFDDEVRDHVADAMRARGVGIEVGCDVASIESDADGGLRLRTDAGEELAADAVLLATGRRPASGGLGLEALGVTLRDNGAIEVDDWSQTAVPSIFAVGDVTDRVPLTPVAIREGHAFADTVFGANPTRFGHDEIASAVFTRPEVGTVGLTEADAARRGPVEIYRARFRPMLNILAGRDERMLMKLVVAKADRRVLGCHIVGPAAAEMIQLAAVAIRMGATKEDFDRTVAVHPTAAEELVTLATPVVGAG